VGGKEVKKGRKQVAEEERRLDGRVSLKKSGTLQYKKDFAETTNDEDHL